MFAEFTLLLLCSFTLSVVVCSAFMWGPGRRCRQPRRDPGEPGRKPELVSGVQGHCGGRWEHGSPAEVSKCEKARVQATGRCSTERRGCQALGAHVHPVGRFLFSCLSQRGCLIFCKETCFLQQGWGDWGTGARL